MPADLMLELEEGECCICGTHEGTPRLTGHDVEFLTCGNRFVFRACSGCGHLFLSPRPRMQDMEVIYANYLTNNRESAYYPSPLAVRIKNGFDARRMRPVLARLGRGSCVLDIGAGEGRLLRLIQRISKVPLRLYANEIAFDQSTRRTLQQEEIRLLEGPIEECDTQLRFDAITGIHVIEHVFDPRAVFAWIAAHLNPGGVLYFETPDAAAFCRRIFGDNWGMTHFPRHINLFSKGHMATLARDAGLTIIQHGNTTSAPAWNMSIRNTLKVDALTKRRSVFEMFNYSNPVTLGAFTIIDIILMSLRVPTSTQQLVALKP
jgi:2-polyprenyl-3-methyl-5-hydroxy-6-metoxy-1,4-benzoquinol methylase